MNVNLSLFKRDLWVGKTLPEHEIIVKYEIPFSGLFYRGRDKTVSAVVARGDISYGRVSYVHAGYRDIILRNVFEYFFT